MAIHAEWNLITVEIDSRDSSATHFVFSGRGQRAGKCLKAMDVTEAQEEEEAKDEPYKIEQKWGKFKAIAGKKMAISDI